MNSLTCGTLETEIVDTVAQLLHCRMEIVTTLKELKIKQDRFLGLYPLQHSLLTHYLQIIEKQKKKKKLI